MGENQSIEVVLLLAVEWCWDVEYPYMLCGVRCSCWCDELCFIWWVLILYPYIHIWSKGVCGIWMCGVCYVWNVVLLNCLITNEAWSSVQLKHQTDYIRERTHHASHTTHTHCNSIDANMSSCEHICMMRWCGGCYVAGCGVEGKAHSLWCGLEWRCLEYLCLIHVIDD